MALYTTYDWRSRVISMFALSQYQGRSPPVLERQPPRLPTSDGKGWCSSEVSRPGALRTLQGNSGGSTPMPLPVESCHRYLQRPVLRIHVRLICDLLRRRLGVLAGVPQAEHCGQSTEVLAAHTYHCPGTPSIRCKDGILGVRPTARDTHGRQARAKPLRLNVEATRKPGSRRVSRR
jgi:hypothetical protein